jgi:hypothetical protein
MRKSAAMAFVNSEWAFAVFQSFGKLRQKSRWNRSQVFSLGFRKLFFSNGLGGSW